MTHPRLQTILQHRIMNWKAGWSPKSHIQLYPIYIIAKELKDAPNLALWLVFRQMVNLFYKKVANLTKGGYCDARAPSKEGITSKNQINLHITKQMSPGFSTSYWKQIDLKIATRQVWQHSQFISTHAGLKPQRGLTSRRWMGGLTSGRWVGADCANNSSGLT